MDTEKMETQNIINLEHHISPDDWTRRIERIEARHPRLGLRQRAKERLSKAYRKIRRIINAL